MKPNSKIIDVLAWNVYIGNSPDEVRPKLENILIKENPEVAGLMEATRMRGHLQGLGYQVIQLKPRPKHPGNQPGDANIAILVRNDVEIVKKFSMRMKTFWKGPKHGLHQDPRVYRGVKIKWVGRIWKIGVAHTPFGEEAREESRNRLILWFTKTFPGRPTILVLDANMSATEFRIGIADPGEAHVGGHGIDLIAVKNCQLFMAKNLGNHGSDHPAMFYRVVK